MFFENEADRILKRFLSDPFFGMEDSCEGGGSCCEQDHKENDVMLRGPGVRYYGLVVTMGPDGRPIVHEYGNARPGAAARKLDVGNDRPSTASETREPLVDTIVDEKERVVKLIAEMPGVEKRDIKIAVEGKYVSVSTDRGRKYQMRIPLERKVNANSAKATYRNGILQITFSLVEGSHGGKTIRVE